MKTVRLLAQLGLLASLIVGVHAEPARKVSQEDGANRTVLDLGLALPSVPVLTPVLTPVVEEVDGPKPTP
jgi:hypothetical protein